MQVNSIKVKSSVVSKLMNPQNVERELTVHNRGEVGNFKWAGLT